MTVSVVPVTQAQLAQVEDAKIIGPVNYYTTCILSIYLMSVMYFKLELQVADK